MEKVELYAVTDDWYEGIDVSGQHPEITAKLQEELNVLRADFPAAPPVTVLSSTRRQDTDKPLNQ
jgi:hypothetical protein